MTKMWSRTIVVMAALVFAPSAWAHGGHLHKALGTIAAVQGTQVEITTTDGKTVRVMLDGKTAVTRGKDKLDTAALKVGERVAVDYMEENKTMMARAIKLGTTAAARK
jgi:hypothetical protein